MNMRKVQLATKTLVLIAVLALMLGGTSAFQTTSSRHYVSTRMLSLTKHTTCMFARRTMAKERTCDRAILDGRRCDAEETVLQHTALTNDNMKNQFSPLPSLICASAAAVTAWTVASENALAAIRDSPALSTGIMSPQDFQPVCATSDGFYRFLQSATVAVVGKENFVEYSPLIAGGLLRIRLELCVIESFFNEAIGPFIAENGISWVLPLHETVETFLAGTIFALATTFILVGSSKILSVIAVYTDFLVGAPSRLLGGYTFDRAAGKPVTWDIGIGPFKTRVIGPPEEEIDEFDLEKVSLLGLGILVISAVLRTFGQAVGVSISVIRRGVPCLILLYSLRAQCFSFTVFARSSGRLRLVCKPVSCAGCRRIYSLEVCSL